MRDLFLDLETSGVNPDRHSILSIGMVISYNGLDDYQSFYREIKYDELIISPASIEVNNFSFTDQTDRVPILQADEEATSFIKKHYPKDIVPPPIGLNIGFFDMQFIRKQMPLLYERLGFRTIDLNSIIYVLAEKHSKEYREFKYEISNKAEAIVNEIGLGLEKHNALFDAVYNLSLYLLIKKDIHS